ncbi:uncharacterized protein FIBRA_00838 [Fibroporia radiculosa]|uniref:NAD(P)-binding protein n=1 Tax=Fibroporia radiculosa TaxID=599839 RepID=J4G0M7_9APHY|nr:uncharacterized protein FIBRA_00838 [Fibroporia radiculosa]CCL98833.1 predicted protein [Fibroporia radiculosa]
MPSYAIVGGSRGIGLEFVRQLATSAENIVFVTVRDKTKSTHLSELISELPYRNVHVLQADVVDPHAMKAAAAEAAKISGGILDVLINNAARMEPANMFKGFEDFDSEDELDTEFIESFKVNVLGVVHAVNAFLPLLRKGTTKKIIVIGSGAGERTFVWNMRMNSMVAYGTTKAATNMVSTKYAAQLEPEGFVVVSISPGFVDVSATATGEYDEAGKAEMARQVENLRKVRQDSDLKPLTPEQSVRTVLKVIGLVGPADSGSFVASAEARAMQG